MSTPSDQFRCERFACTLSFQACIQRQMGGKTTYRTMAKYALCTNCPQGKANKELMAGFDIKRPPAPNIQAQTIARRKWLKAQGFYTAEAPAEM